MTSRPPIDVGDALSEPTRIMTRERMRWYCDALETAAAATGEFVIAGPTIHSDDEFARANGLPGIIADGMISTNWISGMLYRAFGEQYLASGELQTKFIRPVYEDERIETHGRVVSRELTDQGARYVLDVWCQTSNEEKCTVGQARVLMPVDTASG